VAVIASKTTGEGSGRGLAPPQKKNIILIITTYYFLVIFSISHFNAHPSPWPYAKVIF